MSTSYHNHAHIQSPCEQNDAESTNSPHTNTYLRDPKEVAEEVLGPIEWLDERTGFGACPGRNKHTTSDGPRDFRVTLDGTPGVYCFHASCSIEVAEANRRLRDALRAHPIRIAAQDSCSRPLEQSLRRSHYDNLRRMASEALPVILEKHASSIDRLKSESPLHGQPLRIADHMAYLCLLNQQGGENCNIWIGDICDSGAPEHLDHWKSIQEWSLSKELLPLGPYVCPAEFKSGTCARRAENIIRRLFLVVECDQIDPIVADKLKRGQALSDEDKARNKETSLAIVLWLRDSVGLRLRAVVDSGNKSLHAHFEMPSAEALEELEVILPELKCDPATLRASQPVRMPGYTSKDGRTQPLIYCDLRRALQAEVRLPSAVLHELLRAGHNITNQTEASPGRPTNTEHATMNPSETTTPRPGSWESCRHMPESWNSSNSSSSGGGVDTQTTDSSNSSARQEQGSGTEANSSDSSLPTQDWPRELQPEAYHGIAGKIVRMIEPHTEADKAALLFQFLAAMGNLVARDAWISADGARHHLNLFIAIVGATSKGRKGTSWNQIARLISDLDEKWKNECITNGLSSGEGLIYAVRDPIIETKPVKAPLAKAGETESFVKDPGVEDKRLLVTEGELVSALNVMSREGNTLSAVIRQAWDGGNLNTLVKNNSIRSTAPHISIIGHITKEELIHSLGKTEMANGFANRFLWIAAKRSKILPEGGAIDTVDFSRVINCLRSVIDFAQSVGEITRAEITREQWRADYTQLSEGKPGLVGKITGRAEAQVMRLSALYALLDRSKVILPVHHLAAMAVWKYCEDTARWLFGNRTGDKNADKILAALRNAGKDGMSRTEISDTVFKRNLSAHDLHEALQKLVEFDLIRKSRVATRTGATEERWFFRSAPPM